MVFTAAAWKQNKLNVLVQTDSLLAETPSYDATCIVLGLIATLSLLLFALICPWACQISLVCFLFSGFCNAPEANLRETVLLKVFWNHSWNMMHNLLRLKQWQNVNVSLIWHLPLNWFLVYKKNASVKYLRWHLIGPEHHTTLCKSLCTL